MQRQVIVSSKMNLTSCSCPFLINLPSEIIINILLRLPIRTILSCRCVCKQLLDLLSTPEFAASHLSLSTTPGLAIRLFPVNYDLCQIFEIEDEIELQQHNVVIKFDPSMFGFSGIGFMMTGSVNGILCLEGSRSKLFENLYICNPVTREYIVLPRFESIVECPDELTHGFGVSRISGQYKVVRNVHRSSPYNPAAPHSTIWNYEYECLVYTLGTRSWRHIQPDKPFGHSLSHSSFILFLNGNLHELRHCEHVASMFISCFDLETESYIPFPPPPQPPNFGTLGILDDCLCFIANISRDSSDLVIWVMKDYAVKESWTMQFVIAVSQDFVCTFYDAIYPIKAFEDGDILLYDYRQGTLFYFCSKTRTCKNLDLGIQDRHRWIEVIRHNSSFLSLKSFQGENVELF